MDEEPQASEQKISLVVGILGTLTFLCFDAVSLIPGVGDLLDVPAGIIWFLNIISGMGAAVVITQGVVLIAKAIPGLQEFPLWTPSWLFTWWMENHPSRLTKVVETAAQLSEGGAGELASGAEAATGAITQAERVAQNTETIQQNLGAASDEGKDSSLNEENDTTINDRPSERPSREERAERRQAREDDISEESEGDDELTNEEKKQQDIDEEYEKLTETEAERPYDENLKRDYFEDVRPNNLNKKVVDIREHIAAVQKKTTEHEKKPGSPPQPIQDIITADEQKAA
jgi:hypothetical protein